MRHCICLDCNFDSILVLVGVEINLWNFDLIRLAIAETCGNFEATLREVLILAYGCSDANGTVGSEIIDLHNDILLESERSSETGIALRCCHNQAFGA